MNLGEFATTDSALPWLKQHRKTILVGSIVVIAGVVFVVISEGLGLLVLAPAMLVASSAPRTGPQTAQVSP